MTEESISKHIINPIFGEKAIPVGSTHLFLVKFRFLDDGGNQNQFQGDSLQLEWTFSAMQTKGVAK